MSAAGPPFLPEFLTDEFAAREYDLTSRHVLVARIVSELCAPTQPVLDVGGSDGLTAKTLPAYRVFNIDLRMSGIDAAASGTHVPFRDTAFSAALALDVLEHVPQEQRPGLIDEATRVAEVVILAGPYDDPAVAAEEQHQRDVFMALFGKDHPWLEEHAACGLPSLAATVEQLEAAGLTTMTFGSNPLRLWSKLLLNTHIALRMGNDEDTAPLRRWLLRSFLDRADSTPPSYRQIVVAARRPDLAEMLSSLVPGCDGDLVAAATRDVDIATGRVIDSTMVTLNSFKDELAEGWKLSALRIRELEEEGRRVRNDLERGAPADRTVAALESALMASGYDWLDCVKGPDVTAPPGPDHEPDRDTYHRWATSRSIPSPAPTEGPTFSLLTPVFNPDPTFLEACIRSVRAQSYLNWELVLVDASDAPHVRPTCRRFGLLDDRVQTVEDVPNDGIAANTNVAAHRATGEWLVFLDHDDELAPHALAAVASAVEAHPEADLFYSDEDKLDAQGRRGDPFFKPDWSPDLIRTVNYLGHLVAVRHHLFHELGGLRLGFDGAQDYDFVLRAAEAARAVVHIPDVLYHWRQHDKSTAADVRVKPDAHTAGRRALQDCVSRSAEGSWVDLGPGPTSHRVRYPLRDELVSIIVPFRDQPEVTDACLQAINRCRLDLDFEVLLVSNRSQEAKTLEMMETWRERWEWIRLLDYDHPFNFQALNNFAAGNSAGPLLLFLNNDTEPLHPGWLEALAEHAQRPEVGAVGARLFFPDGRVQHAGVTVGLGGFADHPWGGLHPETWTPAGPSYWTRNFLAVTAACLMVSRQKFEQVGGFDERFLVCGGDVDLGLRLHNAGYWNVMTPFSRVLHHESVTRDRRPPECDTRQSLRAYSQYLASGDPFYNPNLTLFGTSCAVAAPGPA